MEKYSNIISRNRATRRKERLSDFQLSRQENQIDKNHRSAGYRFRQKWNNAIENAPNTLQALEANIEQLAFLCTMQPNNDDRKMQLKANLAKFEEVSKHSDKHTKDYVRNRIGRINGVAEQENELLKDSYTSRST
ncbi:MAG: hypothetical protein Q9M91_08770 [Candidatus Dojkabacteria bacterium]|nr:hypothetical protein [Candidatus Dojkabacteria bacterium]MDQ7021865.1 hypothetical protein [Candidatus Dojkabacteria bacterium]